MSLPPLSTISTLALLDLRRLVRDKTTLLTLLTTLTAGATAGLWLPRLDPDQVSLPFTDTDEEADAEPTPTPLALCVPSETPRIAQHGPLPDGLALPGTLVDPDDPMADLALEVIEAERPRLRSWVAHTADPDAVSDRIEREHDLLSDCMRRWRTEQSEALLEDLGIRERFDHVVRTRTPDPLPRPSRAQLTLAAVWQHADRFALLMASLGSLLGFSLLLDTVPRTRQSGWEETLAALGVSPALSSVALWALATAGALLGLLLCALAHALAAPWLGWHLSPLGALAAVTIIPCVTALVHLMVAPATDLAGAAFRAVGPLVGVLYGPPILLFAVPHHWAVLAPTGAGVALLLAHPEALPLHLHALSAVASLAWTALAVALAARRFETRVQGAHSADPVALRHSQGHFGRETVLLCLLAAWAYYLLPGNLGGSPVMTFVVSQGLGFVGTGLLVVLALPVRLSEVLSWRRPDPRAMATGLLLPLLSIPLLLSTFMLEAAYLPGLIDLDSVTSTSDTITELSQAFGGVLTWAVPGLCEEVFFRGAMLGLLLGAGRAKTSRARTIMALLVQAMAFGAIHSPVVRVLPTTLFGLVCGLLVLRGRSLWPAIVAHMLHNFLLVNYQAQLVDLDPWALLAVGLLAFPLVIWGPRPRSPDPA